MCVCLRVHVHLDPCTDMSPPGKSEGAWLRGRGFKFGDPVGWNRLFSPCSRTVPVAGWEGSSADMVALSRFVRAVVTRALFILVSLTGVWRVTWVKEDLTYWLLTSLLLPLVLEMIITLRNRKGNDYKW